MGLRERNAARTRELILDAAMELFLARGYEATKMEDVAEAAEIGVSTLYRYFPTKDELIVEPLAFRGRLAEGLRGRPAEEPLDIALGHAMTALLTAARADRPRLAQIRAVVEATPGPRAKLLEEFVAERARLEEVVAERLGRDRDDVYAVMTARLLTAVLELFADRIPEQAWTDPDRGPEDGIARLRELLDVLHAEPPTLPRL